MTQENQNLSNYSAMHNAYVSYLEKQGLSGKTLEHYPDAVEKYIPNYVSRYIDANFDSFYSLDIDSIKKIFEILKSSTEWKEEIVYKTWNLRMKAIEYFIAFKEFKE